MRAEWRLETGKALKSRFRAKPLVASSHAPAGLTLRCDGDQVRLDVVGFVRGRGALLATQCECIGAGLREVREAVVKLLSGVAHVEGFRINQLFC